MSGDVREPVKLGNGSPPPRAPGFFTDYQRARVGPYEARLRRRVEVSERKRELVRRFREFHPDEQL